jgi:hypothetical protein
MKNLNFRKLAVGVGIGLVLLGIYLLDVSKLLDFLLIRWEYIFPPIIGVYYLSIQPYLNYADAKTYFISGAKFGLLLALSLIMVNIIYEVLIYGQIGGENMVSTLLSYLLFSISYMVVAGVGHYLFNRNVDPARKDIWKPRYYSQALLVAGFTFLASAVLASYRISDESREFYYLFVPVVIAAYIVVRLHHIQVKDFLGGIQLGAVTGLVLSAVLVVVLGAFMLLEVITGWTLLTGVATGTDVAVSYLVVIPILVVSFTFIGGFTGLAMKVIRGLV